MYLQALFTDLILADLINTQSIPSSRLSIKYWMDLLSSWVTVQFVLCISQWAIGNCPQTADSNQICVRTSIMWSLCSSLMDITWDNVRSLRCVGSAASLSTKSHPLESKIGLGQLVLFLRDSCRQGLMSLLVSIYVEIILIILLFYFSWVLNLENILIILLF